nr:glycosyltransferase family 2 protein [Cohnella mopanensis]
MITRLQADFEKNPDREESPLLSQYAATFAETNVERFLSLSEKAYLGLRSEYTLQNYAYASYLNGEVAKCIENVLNDSNVEDVFKSEIVFLKKNHQKQINQLLTIKLLYLARRYDLITNEIDKLEGLVRDVEYANYYCEIADLAQAERYYKQVLSSETFFRGSPLLNRNLAGLFVQKGEIAEAQKYWKHKNALIENYIPRKDRVSRVRFSIVIPTRNSHNTLEYTLRTCLDQQFDDCEIIVSDNSSNELTKEMIDRLADSRIKYIRPSRELAMTENFNFAISQVSGEYVIVLGSDDGLLLHALSMLDCLLGTLQTKVLHWNYLNYGWPDVTMDGFQNYLGIVPFHSGRIAFREMDSMQVIQGVIGYALPHTVLPMLYCNAVIHADILTEMAEITGSVFNCSIPDVYSGFAAAYLQKKYISVNIPMSIGGASGNSNGIAYHHGKSDRKSNEIKNDFLRLNNQAGFKRENVIPNVKAVESAIADAFVNAKNLFFSDDEFLEMDRKKMIQKCADGLIRSHSTFEDDLNKLHDSLNDSPELQQWFDTTIMKRKETIGSAKQGAFEYRRGFNEGNLLCLNAMDFGVTDVYGAAQLVGKITGV